MFLIIVVNVTNIIFIIYRTIAKMFRESKFQSIPSIFICYKARTEKRTIRNIKHISSMVDKVKK